MIGIIKIGDIIFVKDEDTSDKYIENYRAEIGPRWFRIHIDKTTSFPYYEIFEEWKAGNRVLHNRIFATSSLDKLKAYSFE